LAFWSEFASAFAAQVHSLCASVTAVYLSLNSENSECITQEVITFIVELSNCQIVSRSDILTNYRMLQIAHVLKIK